MNSTNFQRNYGILIAFKIILFIQSSKTNRYNAIILTKCKLEFNAYHIYLNRFNNNLSEHGVWELLSVCSLNEKKIAFIQVPFASMAD